MARAWEKQSDEACRLTAFLETSLFGAKNTLPPMTDEIRRLAAEQTVVGLVYHAASGSRAWEEADQRKLQDSVANTVSVLHLHTELHTLLTEHKIPYMILKGAASARYYPDPMLRSMGDVDFLVREEDYGTVYRLLTERGGKPNREGHRCHTAFLWKGVWVELHRQAPGIPDGKTGDSIRSYLNGALTVTETVSTPLVTCVCPNDACHALILLLHTQHHLLAEGIGLRHLCDWAAWVSFACHDGFPEAIRAQLEQFGLWHFARILSLTAVLGVGLPYQPFMGEDRETAEKLLDDILSAGNFGRKNGQRFYQGALISDAASDRVDRAPLFQLARSVNTAVRTRWVFFDKHRLFLPIGWCAFAVHRLRVGKKHGREAPKPIQLLYESKRRKRLYRELRLFERTD